MKLYKYTATDIAGKVVHGRESAEDNFNLVQKLREKNLYCTSYTEVQEKKQSAKFKMKTKSLAFLSRQLSNMLTAGISLVKALSILASQQKKPKAKAMLTEVCEEVQKGRSFSEAIAAQDGAFPPLFVSMVSAGESSGNLDGIMLRVADHYAKDNKTKNKMKSAMMYPIILGVIMLIVVIALFTFVIPILMGMFSNPDDIPDLTKALLAISNSMTNYWYIYIVVIIGLIFGVKYALRVPAVRLKFDRLKCRLPVAGKLLRTIYTGRFARTMSNLFGSGLQMVDCLQKSASVVGNAYIYNEFQNVIDAVKRGESLSASIAKTGIFDGVFTSIIYVGEESGSLDDILEKSADYYDEESDSAITKLVSLLEPIMILVMGILVLIVLMGIYPALFSAYGAAGGQ